MVPGNPGLWWQGEEDVRAPAVTCCIAARECAAVSPAGVRAVGQRRNIGARRDLAIGKEHLALRRNIWALEEHLALEKECLWYSGPQQDCGPEAAPQGWEQNMVLVLS